MNSNGKNQNQLVPVFSEYFSDDNSKCQIWAAYSTKSDKITAYVFLTSSPLTSYVSEDCIAIRQSLLQAANLAATIEDTVKTPEAFKNGYQMAKSLDGSKSLTIKVGKSTDTGALLIALIFEGGGQEHVITLSPQESLGLAKFVNFAVQAALDQVFSMASACVPGNGGSGQSNYAGAKQVCSKPRKTKDPVETITFE